MLPKSQSLNKSTLRYKYGPVPTASTFKYFGDGSVLSRKASSRFQKSGILLGDKFLSPVPREAKQPYFRQSDPDSKPMQIQSQNSTVDNFCQGGIQGQKDSKKTVLKESQISQGNTDKTEPVSILREQVGELGETLKHLEDIINGLSSGGAKYSQEVGSKMRVSSSERTFRHDFQKVFTLRKVPIPSSHGTENILRTLENHLPETTKKTKQSSCFCGNSKQKEEMSGIIFELYQQNRFYERELTKVKEPQRSSILKNAHRMKELLVKVRHL